MKRNNVAVIQAGGKGTRLQTLTKDQIPKPMLPLNGKPMIQWQIEHLKQCGIHEIVLIVGHLGWKISEYFGDGSAFGVKIRYLTETEPLGSAGSLYGLKKWINSGHFLLVFGDVMFDVDLERMVQFHEQNHAAATLLVHPNSHPHDSDLILIDETGRVTGYDSKKNIRNYWYDNCVNAGIYVLEKEILDLIHKPVKTDLEKDLLFPLIKTGRVFGYRTTEYVRDAGTPERFAAVAAEQVSGLWRARNWNTPQRCIFLDRDGTINQYRGLVDCEEKLELETHAAAAIRMINQSGFLAIVITNQPVVARGMCEIEDVKRIHRKMSVLLGRQGAYLDAVCFCPHHPDSGYPEENPAYKKKCHCRKPDTGLIDEMVKKYNIDRAGSYFIGDSTADIQTGVNAGLKTILVHTGQRGNDQKYQVAPDWETSDLLEAVNLILRETNKATAVESSRRGKDMKTDYREQIYDYIDRERAVLENLPVEEISQVMNVLEQARLARKRIFICGNGGSASTAAHYECDFNKGVSMDQEVKYDFECLSDNVPMMMAVANDLSYDDIFVVPLKNKLRTGDVVIGISGSGNSENIVRALQYANQIGAETVALTGYDGGRLKQIAKHNIHIKINNMQIAEDIHLMLDHMMMSILSGQKGC